MPMRGIFARCQRTPIVAENDGGHASPRSPGTTMAMSAAASLSRAFARLTGGNTAVAALLLVPVIIVTGLLTDRQNHPGEGISARGGILAGDAAARGPTRRSGADGGAWAALRASAKTDSRPWNAA
jgi:hypothetical protein